MDVLAWGASTRGVTLGSILLFYSSPARTLSTRHLGHQSPSHQLGRVLHCDISGRGSREGRACCVWRELRGGEESGFFLGLALDLDFDVCKPKKQIGFFRRREANATHSTHALHDCHALRYHNRAHARAGAMAISALGAEYCVVLQQLTSV